MSRMFGRSLMSGARRRAILVIALLAFGLAQALAVAHASRHAGGDAGAPPAGHVQLCSDCASMLPLLAVAGGMSPPQSLAAPANDAPTAIAVRVPDDLRVVHSFQPRAPPR
jgi:hypothetical protein